MIIKLKRKIVFLLVCMILTCTVFCTSCINGPLRRKMIEYYSNDANYVELTGMVVPIEDNWDKGDGKVAIDILTPEHYFLSSSETGQFIFKLYTNQSILEFISMGDTIQFVSAPMHFYSGHILPIISIKKQGVVLLSFEEGKGNYIDWIKDTFSGV